MRAGPASLRFGDHEGVPVAAGEVLLLAVAVKNAASHISVHRLLPHHQLPWGQLLTHGYRTLDLTLTAAVVIIRRQLLSLNLPTQVAIFLMSIVAPKCIVRFRSGVFVSEHG